MTESINAVITVELKGGPKEPEGSRVMLEILDAKNSIIACFPTDCPDWALDQFFRNRDMVGHTYTTREIKPSVFDLCWQNEGDQSLSNPRDTDNDIDEDADLAYDSSLIKVHQNLQPRYSGTDHVEHGRPHRDHGDQEYDPSSLDVLSGLEPSNFKRSVNVTSDTQSDHKDDPVEP